MEGFYEQQNVMKALTPEEEEALRVKEDAEAKAKKGKGKGGKDGKKGKKGKASEVYKYTVLAR